MPVQRSSSSDGAYKVNRKVRVALGNSKGSGDGVRTLRPKSSIVDKAHRKARVATEESKGSSDGVRTQRPKSSNVDKAHRKSRVATEELKGSSYGVRTVESKRNGSKKVSSIGNSNEAVSYVNVNEKPSRDLKSKSSRVQRDLKTKSGNEGFEAVIDGNSGQKRKRIYADPGMVDDRMFHGFDRNSSSKSNNNGVRLYLDKVKKVTRGKVRELKDSSRNTLLTGSNKFNGSEFLDKKIRRGNTEGADKQKHVQENGLGNGTWKTSDKRKTPLATKKDLNQRNYAVGSVEKPRKKKDQGKKSLGADSDLTEGPPPKKKKRVIRIDPHDVSNKRLDDGIANNEVDSLPKVFFLQFLAPPWRWKTRSASSRECFYMIIKMPHILSNKNDNLIQPRQSNEIWRSISIPEINKKHDDLLLFLLTGVRLIILQVFRNKLEFFAAAKISSSFPSPDLPEIAFAGRSNVGKSSLLNALTRQWGVVRTSDKPGLTQTINFFKLGAKLSLVDLPGYGFAYAKEEVKEAWEELVKEYVTTRVGLKRVCVLVDTKWGMKPRDLELIDLMERFQTKYQIVLTKTDLVFPIDVARRAMQIEENFKAKKSAVQPLMMVSSKTGAGIRSLRTVLANVARLVRH
ncbi:hypothetical protein DH2020_000708 [Rehmannia glutinosa]|uniref:EngB-type G domain-containing protein n=1 Tax=Rehmannia glutinosa TaxID=99300 RepID=A0ABR0XXV2_REHGL